MPIPEAILPDLIRGDTWGEIKFEQTDTPAQDFTGAVVRAQMKDSPNARPELEWTSAGGTAVAGAGFFRLNARPPADTAAVRPGFYTIEVELTLAGVTTTYGRLKVKVLEDFTR